MSKGSQQQTEQQKMVGLFEKLSLQDSKSLLKKHLTADIHSALKDKKTSYGGTLDDCIRSGCLNAKSGVGIYACDPEAYTVFRLVFDKVIKDYHKVEDISHPGVDFGGDKEQVKKDFPPLDPSGDMIKSTRVRVGRSHEGKTFGFPPVLTKEVRLEMENKTVQALSSLGGELKGTYYSLKGMQPATQKQLTEDHFLFKDDDKYLRDAYGYEDWPEGRGIFHNEKKTFLAWINEEDHMRFISMQPGGDLAEVYLRLVEALKVLGKKLEFARSKELGFLTFCPSNLGTALRASVHIKIPFLSQHSSFDDLCQKYHVQARGIHGEHTESEGGVYDISNKRRLGLTEYQAIKEMYKGVEAIIKAEKELAAAAKS